jgi:hypothetical protein
MPKAKVHLGNVGLSNTRRPSPRREPGRGPACRRSRGSLPSIPLHRELGQGDPPCQSPARGQSLPNGNHGRHPTPVQRRDGEKPLPAAVWIVMGGAPRQHTTAGASKAPQHGGRRAEGDGCPHSGCRSPTPTAGRRCGNQGELSYGGSWPADAPWHGPEVRTTAHLGPTPPGGRGGSLGGSQRLPRGLNPRSPPWSGLSGTPVAGGTPAPTTAPPATPSRSSSCGRRSATTGAAGTARTAGTRS